MEHRNVTLDIYKGILIMLVVIGHALQYSVIDMGGVLYNVIWAVQMPGFMIVSGYFSVKKVSNKREALNQIKRNTERYLVPFIAWFVLIDVFLLGSYRRNPVWGLMDLFKHVDRGLWFIWVVYILSFASTFFNYIVGSKINIRAKIACIVGFCILCLGGGMSIGIYTSYSLFGMKYILWYSVYYGFGWVLRITETHWKTMLLKIKNVGLFFCLSVFLFIVWNWDLFHCEDDLYHIILRCIAGFAGNAVIFGMIRHFESFLYRMNFALIGKFTLEIYVTHMYFNHLFWGSNKNSFFTLEGFGNFMCSLFCTILFSSIVIMIFKSIPIANTLFYGKKGKDVGSKLL